MKKLLCLLLVAVFLVTPALAADGDTLVYITRTGECYHRGGCSFLESRIDVSLEDAVDLGYRACSLCDPPRLTSSQASSFSPSVGYGTSDDLSDLLDKYGVSISPASAPSTSTAGKGFDYYLDQAKDSELSTSHSRHVSDLNDIVQNASREFASSGKPEPVSTAHSEDPSGDQTLSRLCSQAIDYINFRYLGFLALLIVFITSSIKSGRRHEREVNDAFRQGFLAAVDMDDNKVPRSNPGSKEYPATEAQLRINSFWVHGRRSHFSWYTTPLYKSAYSEGYRMGKNDAEAASDKEDFDFVNSYRQLQADYDYLQRKYAILTSDDFDDEFD